MDDLTPEQVAAVAQLRELTNGSDEEVAVNVLRSVDWDVEVSIIMLSLRTTAELLLSAQPTFVLVVVEAFLHLHLHQWPEKSLRLMIQNKDTSIHHHNQQQYVSCPASR